MYWKLYFSFMSDCTRCCTALIMNDIKIVEKNAESIIIKTDVPYNDLLKICLKHDVTNIKECYIRNWFMKGAN